MTANAARYANWKAPALDGDLLIWPAPSDLLRETRENARLLISTTGTRISGIALPSLRQKIRAWLGHLDDSTPLVATGHQTELYHPGVWAKDILTNAIAERVGGTAFHFAVDTDQPKHLSVRWPGQAMPISDDAALDSAYWSGQIDTPTPAHLKAISQHLRSADADWSFQPMLDEILGSLRRSSIQESSLSSAITNAQHELDWNLGLRHHAMLCSPLFTSREYLVFVHHILSRAEQFASDYNRSLADYRVEAGITSSTRPMPDLRVSASEVEVPFWLDDLSAGSRARAAVYCERDEWVLKFSNDHFILKLGGDGETNADALAVWLRQHKLRLSPRALTLTTFLRLLVVDQFVHGIGGGRYDQVTDRVLKSHFGIEPPRFAVTTATMFFPGAAGQSRVCAPCIAQEGHRLKHALLGDAKQKILDSINSMPRHSVMRALAFHNMHNALSAAAIDNPTLVDWTSRYEIARQQEKRESVLFDRELFYAMQSRDRLQEMIAAFRRRFNDAASVGGIP